MIYHQYLQSYNHTPILNNSALFIAIRHRRSPIKNVRLNKLKKILLVVHQNRSTILSLKLGQRFDVIVLYMSLLRKEVEAVLKGMRNGLEYGSKVRFVHTLVMTLLFKDIHLKHLPTLLKTIVTMALEHGLNLGIFVLAYKTGYKTLNHLTKPSSLNHFLSGLLFGTLIFGKKTGVNNQIVLYLLSRVMIGLATLAYAKLG